MTSEKIIEGAIAFGREIWASLPSQVVPTFAMLLACSFGTLIVVSRMDRIEERQAKHCADQLERQDAAHTGQLKLFTDGLKTSIDRLDGTLTTLVNQQLVRAAK